MDWPAHWGVKIKANIKTKVNYFMKRGTQFFKYSIGKSSQSKCKSSAIYFEGLTKLELPINVQL